MALPARYAAGIGAGAARRKEDVRCLAGDGGALFQGILLNADRPHIMKKNSDTFTLTASFSYAHLVLRQHNGTQYTFFNGPGFHRATTRKRE